MWELEQNGTQKTFEQWGLAQPVFNFTASAASSVTLRAVEPVDGEDILSSAFPNAVLIYRSDEVVWVGLVVETPKQGDGSGESGVYRAVDFWHLLDQIVFHQSRKSYDNVQGQLVDVFTTHCWLGQAANGARLTSGGQMSEAFSYAQGVGALQGFFFAFDASGFPQLDIPINEVRDVTCAEVLRLMLRWSPDAVVWIDYSNFNPNVGPIFRCARRGALPAVSFDMSDGDTVGALSITDRKDLVRPSVKLTYEIAEQVNGVAYVRTQEDIYPGTTNGREIAALAATINLQGAAVQTVEQEILTQPIEAFHANTVTRLNWWKQQFPELAGADVQSVSIELADITRMGPNFYPNQLVDGTIADWMNVSAESDLITAKAFIEDDTGGRWKTLPVRLLATNAVTGVYRHNQAITYPEPVPENLARDVWEGVAVLHWQGDITINQKETTFPVGIGQVLNLTGGRPEWETMRALVYQVSVDIETGQTRASFGNPEHLGVGDLVELLRAARSRRLETLPLVRTTGIAGVGGASTFAKSLPNRVNTGKETGAEKHVVKKDGKGEINVDAAEAFDLDDAAVANLIDGKVLRVRELPICLEGEDKKILVIASQAYDAQ